MCSYWPSKEDREAWEIRKFIERYRCLPERRAFEVVRRHERPDWILRDTVTGELVGVEVTSTYLDDRSVPDLHCRPGIIEIPYLPEDIAAYGRRIAETVQEKVRLARAGYAAEYALLLSIYTNEYVTIHMDDADWNSIIQKHQHIFNDIAPFVELVIWDLINGGVLRKRPGAAPEFGR